MRLLFLAICAGTLITAVRCEAAELRAVRWSELAPPALAPGDLDASLPLPQMVDLTLVSATRGALSRGDALSVEQRMANDRAEQRLVRAGVDIDAILARRKVASEHQRRASEDTNDALEGEMVRMLGYLVPLDGSGRNRTDFLLVAYAGACSHAPVPPPNQVIQLRHAPGFEAPPAVVPVWVEGRLRVQSAAWRLNLVDGTVDIASRYAIEASRVSAHTWGVRP